MDQSAVYILLVINLIASIVYYLRTRCEVPFFLAIFNMLVQYRLVSLELGYTGFVSFNYGIDLLFNFDIAHKVSNLVLLGTIILMYSFMLIYKPEKRKRILDNDEYLREFIMSKRTIIIIGLVIFSIFQLVYANNISDGYGALAKLGNTSFIILLFLIANLTKGSKFIIRLAYFALFLFLAKLTWSAALRFQFLGWMIPIGYYLVRKIKPLPKVLFLLGGIVVMMFVFSLARTIQYQARQNLTASQLVSVSFERMLIADDINFIDGFMMMYQIYPRYLDYGYGIEHVNVFLRPIPRTLWPGKPLAGWFQQYAAKYGTQTFAIGFSPTIYGVFYAEMGEIGIVLFGVFWAWLIAHYYRSFGGFNSLMGYICVGILLSALVPILRSGDLAGDFAIVLMSYWPIIVFVSQYKKFVKKKLKIELYKRMAVAA